ncbi:MAG: rfaFH [Halothiobacillaceae bacterium]|nr:MAG: rfaFH [Halothiobacillaceae bacterium]
MTVQRFVALALPRKRPLPSVLPVPRLRVDTPEVAASVAALKLAPDEAPILALCPGAEYGAAKRWPVEHYAAVARTKVAQGWQVWIFGSAKEAVIAAAIVGEASGKRVVNLAGKTTLAQAIDLLSLATAVVSNDSGLMHIAAALDRPLVAIYGSSDPGFTPPMQPQAKILRLDLECSPCFQRECPYGHYRCLRELLPAQVLRALEELLLRHQLLMP